MAPQEHAVERAGPRDEARAIGRRDHRIDQLVHHRVLDAGIVAAARGVRARGMPEVVLLVARRQRLAPHDDRCVEVEVLLPFLVLRRIHGAHARLDAETLQVLHERQRDALPRRVAQEDLELHRLAALVHEPLALDRPSGGRQERQRVPDVVADVPGAVGLRRVVLLREDFVGHLAAERLEDAKLFRRGQAARGQLRVREVALRPRVGAVEQGLVRPFEVERVAERLTYAPVLEDRAPLVEDEGLHPGGDFVLDLFLLDQAPLDRRAGVGRRPVLRDVLLPEVVLAGFERLERHVHVAIVVDADRIEILATDVDGKLRPPVILHAPVRDRAPGIDRLHAVGAVAERWLQRRLLELVFLVVRLRQDRHLADDQRQLAVLALVEDEADLAVPDLLGLRDLLVIAAIERMPLRLQRLEGPDDVVGGDGGAVVEFRLRPERVRDPRPVGGRLDGLGDLAVLGERLVERLDGERVEDLADRRRRVALQDERIQVVERPDRGQLDLPALRRVRVDVLEVLEAGPVLEVAVHRERVAGRRFRLGAGAGERGRQGGGEHQKCGKHGDQAAHRITISYRTTRGNYATFLQC